MESHPNMFSASTLLGTWNGPILVKGTPPLPRGGHTATFIENKLYVFGGSAYNTGGALKGPKEGMVANMLVQDDLHMYDTNTSTWSRVNAKGTPPSPRYAHSATSVGKRLVIFGGFNGSSYLDDVFIFDTGTTTWHNITPKGKLPVARYAHSSSLTFSNNGAAKLLIFGGCGESSVFNELILLDLVSMTWQQLIINGTLPQARAYHTANLIGNKLYIFGGRAGNKYFNDLNILNLETMEWEKPLVSGNVPTPRAYHSSVSLGTKIIIFGGMDGLRCFNETFIFDTSTLKWTVSNFYGRSPPPRHKHSATANGSQVWIFGGMEAPPNAFNDFFMLNISSKELSEIKTEIPHPMNHNLHNPAISVNHIPLTNNNNNTSNTSTTTTSSSSSQSSMNQNLPKPQLSVPPTSMTIEKSNVPIDQFNALREELEKSYVKIEILTGKNWERCSYYELEELEKIYLDGLQKVSLAKKEKMIQMYEKQIAELKSGINGKVNTSMDFIQPIERETMERLQESVTVLQTENMKLKRRLKENGIDSMEVQKSVSVKFDSVITREFLPMQGQGVPSGGAAPLGMDMKPITENLEPLHVFEKRREAERKGLIRIPEEDRIQILKARGITDESLNEEAKSIEEIHWNRLESIASPTENPLPEQQRDLYRKILNQPQ